MRTLTTRPAAPITECLIAAFSSSSCSAVWTRRSIESGTGALPAFDRMVSFSANSAPEMPTPPRSTKPINWNRPGSDRLDFFDAKGAAEGLLSALGVAAAFAPLAAHGLLAGHSASIRAGREEIGVVAQVHPETATQFDINEPVFLLELWLEPLVAALPERPDYAPPSRFPEVRQDLALVVDEATPADRILELVRAHRSNAIRLSADIFDEYRGEGVPEGKKSLAVRLRYQAADRTLTDDDVARVQGGLLKRLEKELGATLRGA